MGLISRFVHSPVGAKFGMAVTGLMLIGFLVAHLSGNLLVFAGPDALNQYAEGLHKIPALLWGARLGLIAIFTIHLSLAFKLSRENKSARPVPYAFESTVQATVASRYMLSTGVVILAYAIYHLAHFTWRVTDAEIKALGQYEVYQMVVLGFRNPIVAGTYIFALLALGLHLSHGASSMFQTLGANHPNWNKFFKRVGPALAILLTAGYISIPVSVLLGILR